MDDQDDFCTIDQDLLREFEEFLERNECPAIPIECECGADKLRVSSHYKWCPKDAKGR